MGTEKRELMMHASKCYAVVFTKLCSDFKKKKDLRSMAILSRNNENCSLGFLYLLRDVGVLMTLMVLAEREKGNAKRSRIITAILSLKQNSV